jgi:S1-C subfamily serine protease
MSGERDRRPDRSRRGFLAGAGATILGGLAGCVAGPPRNDPDGVPGARPGDSPYTEVYRQTIGSVGQVRVYDDEGEGVSQGSGFVFRDGYLATNEHVVADGSEFEVLFRDGQWTSATLAGGDRRSDLAALALDSAPEGARPLSFVDAEPPIGTEVVAIGAPFGLAQSVSAGIVSGQDRSLPAETGVAVADAVQTDAAVNPGNSGGPLLDLAGRVVGVVYAAGGENIAFAVSAGLAERVLSALVADGEFAHAFLGARLLEVSPAVARANGLARARGVLVLETIDGGPAEGVLRASQGSETDRGREVPVGGDVIVGLGDARIGDQGDVSEFLAVEGSPGETVPVTVLRDGTETTVDLTLGRRSAFEESI